MKKSSTRRDKRKQQPTVPRSQQKQDDSGADVDYENDRMQMKQDSSDTVKSSSKVKSGENPAPAGLLENGASISGGSEPAVAGVAVSTSSVVVDEESSSPARVESPALETKQTIRLVSLDKLLRPSLVGGVVKEVKRESVENKPIAKENSSTLCEKDKSVSIIELSDDSDEENIQQFVIKKILDRMEDADAVVEGTSSEAPVRSTSAKSKPANGDSAATLSTKELSIVVKRLPTDFASLKASFGLTEIRDQNNRVIEKFVSAARSDRYTRKHAAADKAKVGKAMANEEEQQQRNAVYSKKEQQQQQPQENGSEGNGKSDAEEITHNDSDSDAPIGRNRNKTSTSIPKGRKNTRSTRKKRAVSDSEEEKSTEKAASASTNGGGNSDEASEASGSDMEFTKSNTASSRNLRASERSKRAATSNMARDSDSDDDGGQKAKADFQPRKKRTRIRRNTSSSDDDEKPTKRKRGRRLQRKNKSDSDADSPNKGRKNIRKLLKKGDLEETTKNAEQEERERKQRIVERQKLYNQVYDEKPQEATTLDQLVLDFDEETKEPLLEVDKKLVKLLKPHQANGIKFMFDACFESLEQMKESKGSGCILAHCMGLGKTLQVVTLTHTLLANADLTGVERVLIVCPLSTVLNWANEYHMWMKHVKKDTAVEVYEISKYKDNVTRANKLMEWHNEGGVMIMGYDMFRNLANPTANRLRKKVRESLQTTLIDPGPELIVCDEGHLLKNEKTSLSQAVNRITTMRRIVLTGTPIQNNMKEYYCMVQFVKPKLLGTYSEYMNRFVNPITNGQYTDSTPYDIQLMRKRAHVLHKLLDGCVQRRDYSVLAPFLPPKLEFVVSIKLTPVQSTLYKVLATRYIFITYFIDHFVVFFCNVNAC
uniref:Helicase ATP-binding domain-containing protein n=1 Tax=Anopheles maculatus TaxID=74869 RepID=A0A182T0D3_9DIPT